MPRNKKEVQSFVGKINFLRWFIPNFAEIIKHITQMLKKDSEVKWSKQAKQAFENIKQALIEAPVLIAPDYTKDFVISHLHQKTLLLLYCYKRTLIICNNQYHSSVKH